jgi:hypothetical protein
MKKVLTIALAAITLMVMVSCGASPHPDRTGFLNRTGDPEGKLIDFAYASTKMSSRADLTAGGKVDLAGFYYNPPVDLDGFLNDFQIGFLGYKTESGCEAELYVMNGADALVFSSTSCSNANGQINITFDAGSQIRLTGYGQGQTLTVTIEDYAFAPVKFVESRVFYNEVTTSTATTR